jgi:DNA processing protein
VTTSESDSGGAIEWALTTSFLRFGSDTLACRLLKDLDPQREGARFLLSRLADALGWSPADRVDRIRRAAFRAAQAMRQAGGALFPIPWCRAGYPELLWQISDPPLVLWAAGDPRWLVQPSIAVVGSRRATPAGVMIAGRLARGLAEAGVLVVSGMARGIDAAAHQAALEAGAPTVAVLGSGADVVYPREHAALAASIRNAGVVISEFPPGTLPLAHHFPLRNRIISGLSRAVVVVEASHRSGSLITARAALEQGREVLAVPGTVASGRYSGCHALIKDGAALVETVEDVLDALKWVSGSDPALKKSDNRHESSQLAAVMAVGEPYSIEDLAARTRLDPAALLAELGRLEVAGIIGRVAGSGFVRFDKSVIGGGHG